MDKIRAPVVDTDQDVNDLMDELGFSQFGSSGKLIHLSAAKGEELYLNVMKRVAAQQKAERTRRDAARETYERKVEKIKQSEPKDLLKYEIRAGVRDVLNEQQRSKTSKSSNPKSRKGDKSVTATNASVDYAQAFSNAVTGQEVANAVVHIAPPPGLHFPKSRVKKPGTEKTEKGKGKGKGKGKKKGKNGSKGKAKGDEKEGKGGRSGAKGSDGKGGKGKGKGKGKHMK